MASSQNVTVGCDSYDAEFYMCGTASFMADIEDGLEKLGVPSKSIQYETF